MKIDTAVDSYLSFRLDQETFAVSVSQVLEILEVPHITRIPQSPEYMRGVVNLRGIVLPVIDTRTKFGMAPAAFSVDTCIIVLRFAVDGETYTLGALVDSVQEVIEIEESRIQPAPTIGTRLRTDFIRGMVKQDDNFLILLHTDRIFSSKELSLVQEANLVTTH